MFALDKFFPKSTVVLMYHQIGAAVHPLLEKQLQAVASWPGTSHLNYVLTFDDAYADFYLRVYPLLVRLKLKAILGIPTALILPISTAASERRLEGTPLDGLDPTQRGGESLCSWAEIAEMVRSGLVVPAVHGHTHTSFHQLSCTDMEEECLQGIQFIERYTGIRPTTLIYPFGHRPRNKAALQMIHRYFETEMRIGSAFNYSMKGLVYRWDAEKLLQAGGRLLTAQEQIQALFNWGGNRLRGC